ncbi:trichohyalin-like [Frankliniella occidentalis]|uniref:Trichohyalin-like n=1 Tax=Frankliniella occidentalis TaxID=133901 RepID=A0A6J1TC18_FRAOC|nr:trichohyalin-like [Frankliniella occidentalis]
MFALKTADGGDPAGHSGRAQPVWGPVAEVAGGRPSRAAVLVALPPPHVAVEEQDDPEQDEEYTSSSEDVTHPGSQDDRGTTTVTDDEEEEEDEEPPDSDTFEDADNDFTSPRPSVAPRYMYPHFSPIVKCAAVPLVHPDQRASKRSPVRSRQEKSHVAPARRPFVTRIGAGDVGDGDVEDGNDDYEDSDDEALPEDIEVPRQRQLGRSQSTHAESAHPDHPTLGSRSVNDLRHREATFTVRSPRTRRQDGDHAVLQDHDGQPISVRRVRSALLHLKSIIGHQGDDVQVSAAAAAPQGYGGTRLVDDSAARRQEHADWFRMKRREEEERRRAAQRAKDEQERREREERERLLQKEIDQEINFCTWRQRKAELLAKARQDEEERRMREEREREENEKREEARKERASSAYEKWLQEKKRTLKEKMMRDEEARQKRERSAERKRELAAEAFQKWREKQSSASQGKGLFTRTAHPSNHRELKQLRCRRCRSQKLLQSAERLSRPATCPKAEAARTQAPRRPNSERRLRFADPPPVSRDRAVAHNVSSMFCLVDKRRDALYESYRRDGFKTH